MTDQEYYLQQKASGKAQADRRAWYLANKGKVKATARQWCKDNPARRLDIARRYRAKNRDKFRGYDRQRQSTPSGRILSTLRSRIGAAVRTRSAAKAGKTVDLLGCSMPDFLLYLESKFEPGMAMDNYGRWEIDHIVPCALFDLERPEHQRACFHFSNLQPLWATDNRKKWKNVVGAVRVTP